MSAYEDPMVKLAQHFINSTYADGAMLGIPKLELNGKTSWTVMHALTRALQYELGIASMSDAFGPTTLATLQSKYPRIDVAHTTANLTAIVQSALYCKGYPGGGIDSVYSSEVQASVSELKRDMGVDAAFPGSSVEPKVMKALLTMDPYVVIGSGWPPIAEIQRWLNGRYIARRDFFIMPCDGHHSRAVAKSMLFAIQYELGMADGTANGVFGPGTQSGLRSRVQDVGATGVWARLFTAAMILNDRDATFGDFTSAVADEVRAFQNFAKLPVTGRGDYQTWASLLVSYGDQSRPGTACDGVTKITPERAATLKSAGYQYVGRYLSAVSSTTLPEKMIQPGELETIRASGLRCFPIYQTWSRSADYFNPTQGTMDGFQAIEWARFHGFKPGTIIYFAVDYDAMEGEISQYVMPHFKAVAQTLAEFSGYQVGVYGPRNVCQSVYQAGDSVSSFVSDMSSGFSGNLGYSLPYNWAFDQIATVKLGSGTGFIEIDKNIASGRDLGQADFDPPANVAGLDVGFDRSSYYSRLLADVRSYTTAIGLPETGGDGWTDDDWATIGGISTTEAVDRVLSYDWLLTVLSRQLRIRKALLQAPVFWELRQWNVADWAADEMVERGEIEDCSTGWGQIFSWVAREARNYCAANGILNAAQIPDTEEDKRGLWLRLHNDVQYNLSTVAYVTMYNAHQIPVPRPNLSTSAEDTRKIIARYNGTNAAADQYGTDVKGVYDVFETYNVMCRSAV